MDWNRAFLLLNTMNMARQWPKLMPMHDAALAELLKMQAGGPTVVPNKPVETEEAEPKIERKW